jgi:SAM-dependent methyltransferase
MNFFGPRTAAERYARGRPFFHPLVLRRVRELLALDARVPRALDVACGTGLSATALRELAECVVGVDASPEMLRHAPRGDGLTFCVAAAERLPFGSEAFDLLTVCQAFHWFDRERFFAEARRTLRAGGWLVVYDDYFAGRMEGKENFHAWLQGAYLKRYPPPPRAPLSFEGAGAEGFRLRHAETHRHSMRFSLAGLLDYLVTQSNVIAAVEGGREGLGEARAWLWQNIKPFFGSRAEASFLFDAPVWCLQKFRVSGSG